jgi:hypothetical protein
MPGVTVTRRRLIYLGVATVALVAAGRWFYDPDRQLARAWSGLLRAVDARNTTRLGRLLAEDYHDRWGYTRGELLDDARLAFFQFQTLQLTAENVRIDRDGNSATVTAQLRVDASGNHVIDQARVRVNSLFTPFTFSWRRENGVFGAWHLVTFDHPELDLTQFRSRW